MAQHSDGRPLWGHEDPAARLAELIATDAELKVAPLRRDVRLLGTLLGHVIREQAGIELFNAVEALRTLAIRHRERAETGDETDPADLALMQEAERIVDALPVHEAYGLTRAFAIYFDLTNLAETAHRRRRRRASRLRQDEAPQPGTLRGTLRRLRDAGLDRHAVLDRLRDVEVVPVFTAHPTEVSRRTVLFKHRRIAAALDQLDRVPLTDADAAAHEAIIAAEITALWQTDDVRRRRPSVTDEIRRGLDYYADVIIDTIPDVYAGLRAACADAYGEAAETGALPRVVRFGSWIGGDGDGNPHVTPDVTHRALQMARETILDAYVHRLEGLVERSRIRLPAVEARRPPRFAP